MNQKELRTSLEKLHTESYGWAVRCCFGDGLMAEDVLQTVYLKILEGKAKFKQKSVFRTWLFAVIRNTAIDFLEREKRLKKLVINQDNDSEINLETAPFEEAFFKKLLNELSPQQSQILHLVFYQNLTIQEASEVMNIGLGTARTHYERGKNQLKKRLLVHQKFKQ
jgi:RNA polymerase sigma-70 factor (ECF subfamily)